MMMMSKERRKPQPTYQNLHHNHDMRLLLHQHLALNDLPHQQQCTYHLNSLQPELTTQVFGNKLFWERARASAIIIWSILDLLGILTRIITRLNSELRELYFINPVHGHAVISTNKKIPVITNGAFFCLCST